MGYKFTYPLGLSGGVTDIVSAASNVVADPCLFQVAQLLEEIHQAEQATPVVPQLAGLGDSSGVPGIGLCRAVPVLQAYVFVRKNPIVGIGLVAGVVGGLVALGWFMRGPRK